MLRFSHADLAIDSIRRSFYYTAIKYFYNSATFKSNDATLQQLKSTGDYRLIVKDHVADSLSKYDADIQSVYDQGDYYTDYFKDILSRLDKITDMTVFGDTSFVRKGKMIYRPFPKLPDDGNKLPTFFFKYLTSVLSQVLCADNNLKPQLDNATRLIQYLKQEYHIND